MERLRLGRAGVLKVDVGDKKGWIGCGMQSRM